VKERRGKKLCWVGLLVLGGWFLTGGAGGGNRVREEQGDDGMPLLLGYESSCRLSFHTQFRCAYTCFKHAIRWRLVLPLSRHITTK
jgi:hypothetical protein